MGRHRVRGGKGTRWVSGGGRVGVGLRAGLREGQGRGWNG